MNAPPPPWDLDRARRRYNISHWSYGYVDVNAHGHVTVQPRAGRQAIDLVELSAEIHRAGLALPVLVRFTDILRDRVDTLVAAFDAAAASHGYGGRYTAVYPIKVNQQRTVVEAILSHGGARVGLEAGSKPELMAVLALAPPGGVIVCNGYKDREYLRLALIGRALGQRVYIVIEKLSELDHVINEAADLGITPLLGLRVRLASVGAGKWQNTGGEKSKFGLSASQVLEALAHLKQAGLTASLELLHFHLGSQIANIRDIQKGLREAARYYAELHTAGAPIKVMDVGGGLGVDYEGTRSRSFCSMNYSVPEYAHNVVHTLWECCEQSGLPHPDLFTEAGRAMTAHHAVLITDVVDHEPFPAAEPGSPAADAPLILHDLWRALEHWGERSVLEVYHDAVHWLSEAQSMYTHGVLNLAQRAHAEQLYFAICRKVRAALKPATRAHREALDELSEKMADKYFCNFSVFQSAPDVWAIEQIFPILPLQGLDKPPLRRAVLEDLTCDSDGRIEHYVDEDGVETTLPVHELKAGEQYLLGLFLVGAYQEILGDMHNLFGDTASVNVELTAEGHRLTQPEQGDTVDALLRYVHYAPEDLRRAYRQKLAAASVSRAARKQYSRELDAGLSGYTYLEE
ncbi:MAG TPA: biosynthetic arginine decarboxylase [Gammaproteobacteria bacterium]|nr:biosynthetic arginine decarboxylase [Gammaproteobacteria bacterium]